VDVCHPWKKMEENRGNGRKLERESSKVRERERE